MLACSFLILISAGGLKKGEFSSEAKRLNNYHVKERTWTDELKVKVNLYFSVISLVSFLFIYFIKRYIFQLCFIIIKLDLLRNLNYSTIVH